MMATPRRRQIHGTSAPSRGPFPQNKVTMAQTAARQIVRTITTLLLATLSDRICKLSLSPIYGSISSDLDIIWFLIPLVVVLSIVQEYWGTTLSIPISLLGYLPPFALPILAKNSGRLGPYWGPRITYALTSFPILFGSLAGIVAYYTRASHQRARTIARPEHRFLRFGIKQAFVVVSSYAFTRVLRAFEGTAASLISWVMGPTSGAPTGRYVMQAIVASLWTTLARSRWTASFGILPLLHVLFFNPHVPLAHNTAIMNATLHTAGWSLIARQESSTGYISVLDNVKEGFRVMRCDHSLLGGEWRNKPEGHPARFNEPIYAIFVMLEAVRLVESRSKRIPNSVDENALIM